jgi:hypothetical protein
MTSGAILKTLNSTTQGGSYQLQERESDPLELEGDVLKCLRLDTQPFELETDVNRPLY